MQSPALTTFEGGVAVTPGQQPLREGNWSALTFLTAHLFHGNKRADIWDRERRRRAEMGDEQPSALFGPMAEIALLYHNRSVARLKVRP